MAESVAVEKIMKKRKTPLELLPKPKVSHTSLESSHTESKQGAAINRDKLDQIEKERKQLMRKRNEMIKRMDKIRYGETARTTRERKSPARKQEGAGNHVRRGKSKRKVKILVLEERNIRVLVLEMTLRAGIGKYVEGET
eukprot:4609665-Pleurochrysis_carterae.AAC.1